MDAAAYHDIFGCDDDYDDFDYYDCDDDMMYGVDLNDAGRSLGVQKHLDCCDVLDHVSYCSLLIAEFYPCDRLRHDILELDIASFFRTAVRMVVAPHWSPISLAVSIDGCYQTLYY